NAEPLLSKFVYVDFVETDEQHERVCKLAPRSNRSVFLKMSDWLDQSSLYDAIFLISVLHIMPENLDRKKLLQTARDRLEVGGFLVVDVPQSETYYNRRKKYYERHKDGLIVPRNGRPTFYKSFYAEELDKLLFSKSVFVPFCSIYQT